MIEINRRSLITGLVSFIAAPAIVRAGSLMPVKMIDPRLIELIDPNNLTSEQIKALEWTKGEMQFVIRLLVKPTAGTKGELLMLSDWTPVPGS